MSAFMVGRTTIDRVLDVLYPPADRSVSCEFLDAEGAALLKMNRRAVAKSRRRPEKDVAPTTELDAHRYANTTRNDSDWVRLVAVACFLYQCAEDGIASETLYRVVVDAERALMGKVLAADPRWDAAVAAGGWGK